MSEVDTSRVVWSVVLILLGCGTSAWATVAEVRSAPGRPVPYWSWDRRSNRGVLLNGLGVFMAVLGGATLRHAIGVWAFPLTLVPLYLAVFLPLVRHNRSVRAR